MKKVNTRNRIMQAALELFAAQGYRKTSIARIETEAGLVPRAGAFYRHFESKEALLVELARGHVSETPEGFGLDRLADFGDTRAELVAVALKYEEAMIRQRPFTRLIQEVRLLDVGAELEDELNADMAAALVAWIRDKPAADGLSEEQLVALVITVFGGWLFYLSLIERGVSAGPLDRDTMLGEWATLWASFLDTKKEMVPGVQDAR